ncbi:MAG: TlpA family protein disulfide reductase [Eubacteriales bacterium]|nr:TlpA family protein disulfide reductase [Eubacteriales bacterium]
MKKLIWILTGLLAAALLMSACAVAPAEPAEATETSAATEAPTSDATEEPAAETAAEPQEGGSVSFSLTTLTGGTLDQTVFSDHKLTMVNYWATWCPPCVGEIPDLVKISDAYADKGFIIVGVLTGDDDVEGAKKFLADQGVTYPVVAAEGFFLEQIQGYQYIPTTLFFDSEGKQVGDAVVGANSYDDWAAKIDELLAQVSE